jgi:polysaccharide biosynthesis/export protein
MWKAGTIVVTRSALGSFSVGTRGLVALALAFAVASWAAAQTRQPDDHGIEVRIGLPAGGPFPVSITFAEGGVVLDLPAGASVPFDVVGASEGILRDSELTPKTDSRMKLTLRLATGILDQARYEPDAVVLRFQRRTVGLAAESGDSANAYRIGVDDKIQISVDGQPDLTRQSVVGPNGSIVAPFIGEVAVAGQTVDQVAARLTDRLARDYLVDPRVNVEVVEYKSQWAMVTGAVRRPGRVPLHGGTGLKEALSEAGGLAPEAGEEITISRISGPTKGATVLKVSRQAFEDGTMNPALRSGDIVSVAKAAYCYVNGEVRNSIRIPMEEGLTLLRAITLAGGFTEWANKKDVQVLSEDPKKPGKTYDVRRIESSRIPDPKLEAGDVIIVKRRVL